MTKISRKIFAVLLILTFSLTISTACTPHIGDECSSSGDCPSGAVCDSTAPNGYCLDPGCTRNSCSKEALCIKFKDGTSNCMKHCEDNSDCRDGMVCRTSTDGIGFCYVAEK